MAMQRVHELDGGFMGLRTAMAFQRDPLQFLQAVAIDDERIVRYPFGPQYQVYMLNSPEYVHDILVKQWKKVEKWVRFRDAVGLVSEHSLAILEGDIWKKVRKLSAPAFHTQRIKVYMALMIKHTERELNQWDADDVQDVDVQMNRITMGIIGEILFGIEDIENDAEELSQALLLVLDMIYAHAAAVMPLPRWLPLPNIQRENKASDYAKDYLMEIIRERRASGEDRGDVLSALSHTMDEETGERLTDEQVRDVLMSLFVAGHETTTQALTFALYNLAKYPEYQERLFTEVDATLQGNTPTLEDLETMTYSNQVINETMRLFPPAWAMFVREALEELQVGDHIIPKGGLIFITPYTLHRDPQFWDNADTFDPEHFADGWKDRVPQHAFIPFGGGPRICIGAHLAMMEMELILGTLVKNFRFELTDASRDVDVEAKFSLHPSNGLPLRVIKRA